MTKELIEEFWNAVKSGKSSEEMSDFVKKKGIDKLSVTDTKILLGLDTKSGELGDDELDVISGGVRTPDGYRLVFRQYFCSQYEKKNFSSGTESACNCGNCKYSIQFFNGTELYKCTKIR